MPDKKKPIVSKDPSTTNPDENATRNFFESLVDDHDRLDEFLKEPESEVSDVAPSADEGVSKKQNSDDHENATRNFFESLVDDHERFDEFLKGPQTTKTPSPAEVTPQFKSVLSRSFPRDQDSKVSEDKASQNITSNVAQKPKRPPRKNDTRRLPMYSRLNAEQKAKEQEVFKQKQEEDRAEFQQRFEPKKRTARRELPTGQTEKRIAVEKKKGLTQDDYNILELRKKEKEEELLKKQEQKLKKQEQQLSEMQTNQASNPGLFSKPQEKFDLVKEAVNLKHRMREQDAFNMVSKEIDPTASSDEQPSQTTNVSQTSDRSPKTKKS